MSEYKKETCCFLTFINSLEGFKTCAKNLHWSAINLNIHKQLDKLLNVLSDYQDSIAEEHMGLHGQIKPNTIKGICCECDNPILLLNLIENCTLEFYSKLKDEIGMKSETENFIHNINKFKYLFTLCV